jgi:redox-sensitive bicupin YhaK (pirin superfamily)
MKSFRKVISLIKASEVMMDKIKIHQAIPNYGMEQISPFILLHHFDHYSEPGHIAFQVSPHPHRGFSPVTFLFEGAIEHEDSLGNKKTIYNNEVQWINAARGIIHSEKADKEFIKKGGRTQGIQLWINLPASLKMSPPSYQPITKNEIELIEKEGVEFRLISGTYEGKRGPAKSDVLTAMLRMNPNYSLPLLFTEKQNVLIYVLEGKVRINEVEIAEQNDLVVFENSMDEILIECMVSAKILLMAGVPIDEPLVTHGPFVMNSQTEILEAMRDYQNGKMGFLY